MRGLWVCIYSVYLAIWSLAVFTEVTVVKTWDEVKQSPQLVLVESW